MIECWSATNKTLTEEFSPASCISFVLINKGNFLKQVKIYRESAKFCGILFTILSVLSPQAAASDDGLSVVSDPTGYVK